MLITNPVREFVIDYSLSDIKIALNKIIQAEPSDYVLVNDDTVLNQFRILQKGRLLDLGYHVDFTFTIITENQTKVHVEVSRNLGTINTSGELSIANNSLKSITDKLSAFLSGNVDEKTGKAKVPAQGCVVLLLIITSSLGLLFSYIF